MKKCIIAIIILLSSTSLFAIEVDIDEIKTGKVDFINYSGRGRKTETVSEIKSIGYRLSYLAKNSSAEELFRYHMKYSVIRALAKDDREKFSADIIFIDRDARVDHIRNVRRIISAYLEDMYGYTLREADAIALYATYYNAVYRSNLDYFSSKYNATVTKHLTKNNAGISTLWSDWPGRTAVVIPLTEKNKRGEIGGIDPFLISDENVKNEVNKDRDNKTTTEEVIKLKEKDIDKSKRDIEEDKKIIDEKKKETQEEKKKIEERKTDTEKKKEEIKKEKEDTSKIPDPEMRRIKEDEIREREEQVKKEEKKISEDEKKIKSEEEKIKKEETEIKKKEENVKKKEEIVNKDKSDVDKTTAGTGENGNNKKETTGDGKTAVTDETLKKREETLNEREKELDRREDRIKDKEPGEGVFALKIYYLEVKEYLEGGHYNNNMYMINTTTKKIDFKSPVTNICGRRYDVFSGGIGVITHTGDHKAGHRLTLIDRETLREIKTGEDNIFWRSFVEIKDSNIYAIIKDQETFYLGKFDMNLKLVARSKEKIHQNTFITFFDKYVYINREDKTIIVLRQDDLELSDVIKP